MGLFDFIKKKELEEISKLKQDLENFSPIINIQAEAKRQQDELNEHIQKKTNELDSIVQEKEEEIQSLTTELIKLNLNYKEALETYAKLRKEVDLYENKFDLIEYGVYDPIYDFERSDFYKNEQFGIVEEQKRMVQGEIAATCRAMWTINGSEAQGRISTKKYIKLALRAFNGECDSIISKVNWNNVNQLKLRMHRSFEIINNLSKSQQVSISPDYLELKIKELILEYEYKLKKQNEKEEAKRIQEEMKEEEKARREIEQAQREAEKEEIEKLKSIEKAQKEIVNTTGDKHEKLLEKIKQLELELEEAREKKDRAISMAQQTKRGHVYIISNIGSFGENIYKIGMTRRLEPLDRVRELGDASVPFRFDVHAMIYSEDAPTLEYNLHKAFEDKSVNLINFRKEFYKVTLDEIEEEIKKYGFLSSLIRIPEAMEYRETVSIIEKSNNSKPVETIDQIIKSEFPDTLIS